MGLEAAGEVRALDGIVNGVYVALHTGDPSLGGNEVTGGSYARRVFAPYSASGSNPTTYSNSAVIQFPVASDYWGVVSHVGIWSASTDGDLIASSEVAVSKELDVGDIARFAIGGMKFRAD